MITISDDEDEVEIVAPLKEPASRIDESNTKLPASANTPTERTVTASDHRTPKRKERSVSPTDTLSTPQQVPDKVIKDGIIGMKVRTPQSNRKQT